MAHLKTPRRLRDIRERFLEGHELALLRDGERAFDAMLCAIAEAREQVLLEMYWFAADSIGQRFAEALTAAAERGVEVAVIYDSVGFGKPRLNFLTGSPTRASRFSSTIR